MAFYCIHTATALQLLASAEATGTQIRLTHMAVGDGNGNPIEPAEGMTSLVRERFRATVNRVYQDPENPLMFTAELIIPASEGGFVIREVGVFDSNGNLFIVGSLPYTHKPVADDGSYSDTVIRVAFMVSNASTVTLQIDPNVVIATQSWIINNVTPAVLFPGGTTGQILKKRSNADGDAIWGDPDVTNVVVDVIEEEQTLAANQTVITWATVTNLGLAVYIEGVRIVEKIGVDGWQIDTSNANLQIILGKSYPAGTRILGVQNEPLGNVPYPLEQSKNLSDVPNKTTARTNLDVYSKTETRANGLPAGSVIHYAKNSPPAGYLKANGAAISRTAYAGLFAAIGTVFGNGDGFNTFNLPDLRGEFIRGWDDGKGIDKSRALGSAQSGALESHDHDLPTSTGSTGELSTIPDNIFTKTSGNALAPTSSDRAHTYSTGGTETRPRNVALLACIKF